jgi:cardiolipin synthase
MGDPIAESELAHRDMIAPDGDVALRVVAGTPSTAGLLRLDQLIASLARERLWLTDAYYAGTITYVQTLRAAAEGGVDVRLLVPGKMDNPLLRPFSRSGYRPLLEAGIRVFEWKGTMIHAKTAVADGRWARVGSSNLNIASWFGNYELDVTVEDRRFGREMETMYLADLDNAVEIVLDRKRRVQAPGASRKPYRFRPRETGSTQRAISGVLRVGSTAGAAITNRRALGPAEAAVLAGMGLVLALLVLLAALVPWIITIPVTIMGAWTAGALLARAYKLWRSSRIRTR